ncbi:FmdB family zinc ribbon protein [Saccharothrix coeruleofusca]|uniref:FmdB family transcriptional regulator n=1 Tax=Saccharothrix coeruleofusca TaxID=33919 RepID=A0A918AKV9_9PSEU|nr:zinc ribbon domain-containing protein [Saccharothrix coeruleofusca]MBP2338731.1 putative FmdB family regulatory protein [Saccharothrix coeruleofusca]GGP46374.1 FmdB family transcriptional regulator [Saccharothrix coeruleofusca]
MPTYEFRCRACGSTFDVQRPMSESTAPATCPHGHDDTVKLLSMVGLGGKATAPSGGGGGGCCGGGCCGG